MEFIKITEQPSLYDDLDKKSVKEILEDINTEDHKVADAVQKAIPQIEKLVTLIIPRVKKGGRIFYMGAGTSGRLGVLDASEIPPTFGMPPTVVIGLIAGGDTALRNPVENAEDDMSRGWDTIMAMAISHGRWKNLAVTVKPMRCSFPRNRQPPMAGLVMAIQSMCLM